MKRTLPTSADQARRQSRIGELVEARREIDREIAELDRDPAQAGPGQPTCRSTSKPAAVRVAALAPDFAEAGEVRRPAVTADDLSPGFEAPQREQGRQRSAEALRDSQSNAAAAQFYAHILLETSPVAIVTYRASGQGVSANAASVRLLGAADVAAVTRLSFRELPLWQNSGLVALADEALASGIARELEVRGVDSFGKTVSLQCRLIPYTDAGGEYLLSFLEDISERQTAAATLERGAGLLRMASRIGRLGAWTLALPARELSWSDEVRAIHEVPPGFVPTVDTAVAFYAPEFRDRIQEAVALCVREGVPFDLELQIVTARGRRVWVRSIGEGVPGPDGRIVRVQGAFQDISESQAAAAVMREQASLLDKARDAIVVRDLEHRILYWNRSAERLYGWTAAEAIGRSIADLLYRDRGRFLAATAATVRTGEWVGEIEQITRDGQVRTVEGHWTLVRGDDGEPTSVLAINTDISGRKQMEQQYLRAQRLESLGTLAGGIAHDLNNVLAPILLSIGFLQLDETDAERLDVLKTMAASATRGAAMVSQVLSFTRGVEGRRTAVDADTVIRDVVRILRDTFPKAVRIEPRPSPGLWTLHADATQLHQVLLNLCVNARDAMPDGGSITIAAENVNIDPQYAAVHLDAQVGPHVAIDVTDTGTGMSAAVIDKIFDPFFTTKEIGKGTGLGLATSLAIIKGHGGFIRVYSEPGAGTRFQVFLPADNILAQETEPALAAPPLPRGRGELVLVVDDEASIRRITRQTLETFGYRVLMAEDGLGAIALYGRHQRDVAVVITDMMMPLMDGLTMIGVLRRMNPRVRIIGATGLPESATVAAAATAGITDFLAKPYTAQTLLDAVRRAVGP